jgi:hypothetical protein
MPVVLWITTHGNTGEVVEHATGGRRSMLERVRSRSALQGEAADGVGDRTDSAAEQLL